MSLRSILCDWLAWLWPFVLVKKEKTVMCKLSLSYRG